MKKRSLFTPPDQYSLSPLFALLIDRGNIAKLSGFKSSLFARYEKVKSIRGEIDSKEQRDLMKRLNLEEEMLCEVLDWLEVKTGNNIENSGDLV